MNHTDEGPCRCRACKPYTTRWRRIRAWAATVPWLDSAGVLIAFYLSLLLMRCAYG